MTRSVCVVTGTRAEYGLLRWVMEDIGSSADLVLQVVATGMHLSPEFGLTVEVIEADGFAIDHRVEMLLSSDTPSAVTKSMGLGLIGFADVFRDLKPDIIVILGDRFEAFAAAAAAAVALIPIAHLHGGEVTEGVIDDVFRHAITKMSHLHFVAAEPYRRRVMQLGECPESIFVVGGLGLDNLERLKLLDRSELERSLGLDFSGNSLLVTFHPATTAPEESLVHLNEMLAALDSQNNTFLIFTLPNADPGGRRHASVIKEFVNDRTNAVVFESLGQEHYLSCLREVDGVVGNSSSGLLEAPSLGTGTVDIGSRQLGRLRAPSVISCAPHRDEIASAIDHLYSPGFREISEAQVSPYGKPGAGVKVVEKIAATPLENIIRKRFVDLL